MNITTIIIILIRTAYYPNNPRSMVCDSYAWPKFTKYFWPSLTRTHSRTALPGPCGWMYQKTNSAQCMWAEETGYL